MKKTKLITYNDICKLDRINNGTCISIKDIEHMFTTLPIYPAYELYKLNKKVITKFKKLFPHYIVKSAPFTDDDSIGIGIYGVPSDIARRVMDEAFGYIDKFFESESSRICPRIKTLSTIKKYYPDIYKKLKLKNTKG